MQTITTKFVKATDRKGESITVKGPLGVRTFPYNYGATDAHADAVAQYVAGSWIDPEWGYEADWMRADTTRSGRGWKFIPVLRFGLV